MTKNELNDAADARNRERAACGEAAMRAYSAVKGGHATDTDMLTDLEDLLADLRHWARAEGMDFEHSDALARLHFECETDEAEDPDEAPEGRPVEDELAEIGAQVPPEEWAKVGAEERLGKAAPDLLQAARCALADLEGFVGTDADPEGDEPVALTMKELRAAIAKAEGGDA